MIRREKGQYNVYSSDGSKHLGGPYKTKEEAVARLATIEYYKDKDTKK